MDYCKTKHHCADGNTGECNQLQRHLGKHLCSNCITFFEGGADSRPEPPASAPPVVHPQVTDRKPRREAASTAIASRKPEARKKRLAHRGKSRGARAASGPKFCTRCGNSLSADARFCTKCGREKTRGARIASNRALRDASPGEAANEGKHVFKVTPRDLDLIVYYSLMSAPLDMAFLLTAAKNSKEWIRAWIPLSLCGSLDGMVVMGRGRVVYVPDGNIGDFCTPSETRLHQPHIDAIENWHKHETDVFVDIEIHPVFKRAGYGAIENDIRGKWATVLDDRGVRDVRNIMRLPLSGQSMKRRLYDQDRELREEIRHCENSNDSTAQLLLPYYQRLLNELHKLVGQMPDGEPDHIYCIVSMVAQGRLYDTVVADTNAFEPRRPGATARFLRKSGAVGNLALESLQISKRPLRLQHSSGLRIAGK